MYIRVPEYTCGFLFFRGGAVPQAGTASLEDVKPGPKEFEDTES